MKIEERDEEVMQKNENEAIIKMMMMMKSNRQDALEFLSLVACENDNSTEARGRASSRGRKRSFYFRPFEMEMSRPSVQRVCIVNHMVLEFGRALRVDQKNGTAYLLH